MKGRIKVGKKTAILGVHLCGIIAGSTPANSNDAFMRLFSLFLQQFHPLALQQRI
jgi:hypothetical protein